MTTNQKPEDRHAREPDGGGPPDRDAPFAPELSYEEVAFAAELSAGSGRRGAWSVTPDDIAEALGFDGDDERIRAHLERWREDTRARRLLRVTEDAAQPQGSSQSGAGTGDAEAAAAGKAVSRLPEGFLSGLPGEFLEGLLADRDGTALRSPGAVRGPDGDPAAPPGHRSASVSYDDVAAACERLSAGRDDGGAALTIRAVRSEIGRGSFTTINEHLKAWNARREERETADAEISAEALDILTSAVRRAVLLALRRERERAERNTKRMQEAIERRDAEIARLLAQMEECDTDLRESEEKVRVLESRLRSASADAEAQTLRPKPGRRQRRTSHPDSIRESRACTGPGSARP